MQDRIDALEAQASVDRAMIAGLQADGLIDRDKIAHLETALVAARKIGAAIGIIMVKRNLTEAAAFDVLRRDSQRRQVKLRVLADRMLYTGTLPG